MSDESDLQLSRRYTTMLVASLLLIVLTCVAFLVPVPYVKMTPGPAFDTLGEFEGEPMFVFGDDVETYPTTGALDFTTVRVTRNGGRLALLDAVWTYFSDEAAIVPRSIVYPEDETSQQSEEQSAAQLDSSKDSSRVAALRAAGYTVPEIPTIAGVVEGGASEDVLKTGDQILAVDGDTEKAATAQAVVEAIGEYEPGDTVRLTISRDGDESDVEIVSRPDADDPSLPRIGVALGTTYEFPVEITNNVGHSIGGPSAGTMFALAIYDRLTPGPLTGGLRVAGTGEMSADGRVGAIGGVRQKMAGAADAKAEVFLVPAANCAEAVDGSDFGMRIVKITTLADAISSLESLADDADAKVPSC